MSLIDKSAIVDYSLPLNEVYEKVKSVVCSIKGMSVIRMRDDHSTVYLETGFSLWSYGEYITISCVMLDDSHTQIKVVSSPKLATTLIDFGKGKRNVRKVLDTLHTALPLID